MDDFRAKLIKEKLSNLKSDKSTNDLQSSTEEKPSLAENLKQLFGILVRMFSVYGALYYSFMKFGLVPFTMWESFVIYFGFTSIISIIKRK